MKRKLLLSVAILLALCTILLTISACGGGNGGDDEIIYNGGIYERDEGRSDTLVLVGIEKGVTSLTIPEKIDGCDVGRIDSNALRGNTTLEALVFNSALSERFDDGALVGESAFRGCSALKSVTLNGKIRIGSSAFAECEALETFIAPNAVSVDGLIFSYESNVIKELNINTAAIDKENDGSYIIPSGIETLTLNGDVNSTGTVSKESLKKVTINSSSVYITFEDCPLLEEVTVSEGATGFPLMRNCPSVTEVTLPKGLASIGTPLFIDCVNLEKITLTDLEAFCKITRTSQIALTGNSSETYDLYLGENLLSDVVIPSSVTKIQSYTFADCKSIKTVTLHNGITEIGDSAFMNCKGLTEIIIPDSVTRIGASAFRYASLTKAVLGSGVSEIGSYAFENNFDLREVYNLSSLNVTKGSSSLGAVAMYALVIYSDLDTPSVLGSEGGFLFYTDGGEHYLYGFAGNGKQITLPSSYKGKAYSIADYAFKNEKILTVTIPEGVKSVGQSAFEGSSIVAVYVESKDTVCTSASFGGTGNIRELYYPVNDLHNLNVAGCLHKYNDKSKPSIITIVGDFAFVTENKFAKLISYVGESASVTLPEDCGGKPYIITSGAFNNTCGISELIIPENAVLDIEKDAFKSLNLTYTEIGSAKYLSGWLIEYIITSDYNGAFELKEGTVGIASGAVRVQGFENPSWNNQAEIFIFLSSHKTNRISLPSSLKHLGSGWCEYLLLDGGTEFDLPENTVYLGVNAIPIGINEISLPESIKYISEGALRGLTITNESFTVTSDMIIGGLQNAAFKNIVIANGVELPYNLRITAKTVTLGGNVSIESTLGMTTTTNKGLFDECEIESLSAPSLEVYLAFVEYCNQNEDFSITAINNPVRSGAKLYIDGIILSGEVTVPDGIETIPAYAFAGLEITKVTFPNSLTKVENNAFYNANITEITFGTGLTDCNTGFGNLTRINLPNVEAWLNLTYSYLLSNLTEIYIGGAKIETLIVPEGITELRSYAFYNWDIERVILPDSLTSIGQRALYSESLLEIEGGMNVSELGYEYTRYETVVKGYVYGNIRYNFDRPVEPVSKTITWARLLPNRTYDSYFFEGCTELTYVYVPVGATLGSSMFYSVGEEFTVFFEESAEDGSAWKSVSNGGTSYTLGAYYDGVNRYGRIETYVKINGDFAYSTASGNAEILAYFGEDTDVRLPSTIGEYTVTKIGDLSFLNRTDITSVTLSEGVKTVGARAFEGCSSLSRVDLGSADTLDMGAFADCIALEEIRIPESIEVISPFAFEGCSNLGRVEFAENTEWEIIEMEIPNQWVIATPDTENTEQNAEALKGTYAEYFWIKTENKG